MSARPSRRRTRAVLAAATSAVLVAGCGSSTSASSGGSKGSGSHTVSRKGTCEIEVAALVDYDIAAARTKSGGGAISLGRVIGVHNPVLLAAETVSATVFKQGNTGGATKAISQQCAQRHDPVLDANALAAVRKSVPAADVAVLQHITITR